MSVVNPCLCHMSPACPRHRPKVGSAEWDAAVRDANYPRILADARRIKERLLNTMDEDVRRMEAKMNKSPDLTSEMNIGNIEGQKSQNLENWEARRRQRASQEQPERYPMRDAIFTASQGEHFVKTLCGVLGIKKDTPLEGIITHVLEMVEERKTARVADDVADAAERIGQANSKMWRAYARQGASGDGKVRRPMTEAEERLIEIALVTRWDDLASNGQARTSLQYAVNRVVDEREDPDRLITPEERAVIEAAKAVAVRIESEVKAGWLQHMDDTSKALLEAVRRLG